MSEDRKYDLDWSKATPEVARLILEQGASHLAAQLNAGLSADQRAMTGASVFVAFGGGILGVTLVYWGESNDFPALVGGVTMSALLLLGSYFCFHAARSVKFYFPGNHPIRMWNHRESNITPTIGSECENYQEMIEINEQILANNAAWLARGVRTEIISPLIAVLLWSIVRVTLVEYC